MTEKEKISTSKFLSLVLRHEPSAANITLDPNGWADVSALLKGINRKLHPSVTLAELQEVVLTNNKQRFAFNADGTKIRANQGHSVNVDVELKEAVPPDILYHGTAKKFIGVIWAEGLKPQSRLHVHLSGDEATAIKVGQRHGKPVVLIVEAAKMYADGHKFYLSENGVWLTAHVPAKYLHS